MHAHNSFSELKDDLSSPCAVSLLCLSWELGRFDVNRRDHVIDLASDLSTYIHISRDRGDTDSFVHSSGRQQITQAFAFGTATNPPVACADGNIEAIKHSYPRGRWINKLSMRESSISSLYSSAEPALMFRQFNRAVDIVHR